MRVALRLVGVAYVLFCAVVDFVPNHGPPNFRYTGSDPSYPVWNTGWPLASFIYDDRSGLHTWPGWWLVVALQFGILLLAWLAIEAVLWLRKRRLQWTDPAQQPL